jgi:formate dehydrogenase subunit delta
MSDAQHLVKMANDIGNFFRAQPRSDAVAGIANHIKSFWSPRMRAKLNDQLQHGALGLDELPLAAMQSLNDRPGTKPAQAPGGDAG